MEVEFSNGKTIFVQEILTVNGDINNNIFSSLEMYYKTPILKIDGKTPATYRIPKNYPSAFDGMTEEEIANEFLRIKNLKSKTMKECKKYLAKAKANQWTISISDLMETFKLTEKQVRECINSIY